MLDDDARLHELDQLLADGDVWVAGFGEIASYVREHHINVGKPENNEAFVGGLQPGVTYYAVVTAWGDDRSESAWSNEVSFTIPAPTGVPAAPPRDGSLRIVPSPNPSAGGWTIRFELRRPGPVDVTVYDVTGRLVKTLHDGHMNAGSHYAEWHGTNELRQSVASGTYFCTLETEFASHTRKVVLMR